MAAGKEIAEGILKKIGITVNGSEPWDIQVHNEDVYKRVVAGGSMALGESYMDGWWDVADMPAFFAKIVGGHLERHVVINAQTVWLLLSSKFGNLQSRTKAFEVGEKHYDIGNDLYTAMLDKRLTYTCGYWKDAKTLDDAQEAKLDLVCRKIGLKKGDRVLDIGGGWGSFAGYAAEKYGASVVAVTVSKEQAALGRERTKGLPVEIRVQDYREISDGPYDHIVSLGMFEHVGHKNYREYMQKVHELLKEDGLFLLHTIGTTALMGAPDPWFHKYIFPNGILPNTEHIAKSTKNLFVMEDWHNFGADYDLTLLEWFKNFDAAWPNLKKDYDERFYRMWKYYLLSMAGTFRSRMLNQLWQVVLSKDGVKGGYKSVR
jgi:cyclopropane-fatty-acyl-phospholipid synthase